MAGSRETSRTGGPGTPESERVGETAVHVGPDAHRGRCIRTGAHDVASRATQPAEVEAPRFDARAECTVAARRQWAEHDATAFILDGEAVERHGPQRADDGGLRRVGEIADLIDAHERRAAGRRRLRGDRARCEPRETGEERRPA